jgi:cellulose 1,4-beta-cellobiosidase
MYSKIAAAAALIASVSAQQFCTLETETHPSLQWQKCSSGGSCSNVAGSVVLDANWRWTHTKAGYANCYTGNKWDTTVCPNGETCASACCVDGAKYSSTYGIQTSGNSLSLKLVTEHADGKSIGSRVYLMENENSYQMFNLLNNEFTFDVDVSKLPCGLNGALYFVSMDKDGGMSKHSGNKAGAKYGTGYCDSQCPRDLKFIAGKANSDGWTTGESDSGGVGNLGACCAEMDIWEANSISTAYTPHPCDTSGYHTCTGDKCGGTYSGDRYAGTCDPDGCDFNSFRQGDREFYGPGSGFTIDTTKKVTVVTQFLTSGGKLSEIRRVYVQNGVVIGNSQSTGPAGDSITQPWCDDQKKLFGDEDIFKLHGGLEQMGDAAKSMVLVLSLWDDYYSQMLWLDSVTGDDPNKPGAARGTCGTDTGVPAEVEAEHPDATVVFSNIKFGPIGSTYKSGNQPPPQQSTTARTSSTSTRFSTSTRTSSSAPPPAASGAPLWGQCGGNQWTGAKTCVSGGCCRAQNEWYSQCIPC